MTEYTDPDALDSWAERKQARQRGIIIVIALLGGIVTVALDVIAILYLIGIL